MKRDRLTILRSYHGALAKTIRRMGQGELEIIGFSAGRWFSVEELEIGSLDELITTLDRLQEDRRACLVRGSPLPTTDRRRTRRLLYPDPQTDAAATFGPAARQWLLIDIDGLEEPAGLDFRTEPDAAVEHAIGLLPKAFHEVSGWWQATGSAGIKPGIRLRLAFWLSRPLSDQEARAWLRGFPCDLSLYTPVQPHYVARPVLQGVPDPMVRRSGRRSGLEDVVAVPDIIEPPVEASRDTGAGEGLHEARGFEGHLQQLGDGDGLLGFKGPLTSAIASYVAEHGAGVDVPALKARLREAIAAAPKRPGRAADIARYGSDHWLDALIRWVIDRERQRPPRDLQAKQATQPPRGPPPWITEAELPPDAAAARLKTAVVNWGREALDWLATHAGTPTAPPPPHAGVKATTGLGKTRLTLQMLAAIGAGRTVHYYVPTLVLAEEVATEARTLGINAMVLRGREALILGTDETMCAKADVAKILGRHGLPVWAHLCQRKDKDAEAEELCEHYDTCPYVAQFEISGGKLIVLAHEYLTLPKQRLASPDLVVIDERFHPALIRNSSLPVERLAAPKSALWFIKDEKVADHLDRAAAVRQTLLNGKHVRESGVSCEELKAMAGMEMTFASIPKITPGMCHADQRRRAAQLAEIEAFRLSRVWRLLAEDYDRPRPSQRVVVRRGVEWHGELQDRVFLYWRAALQLPLASTPALLLDADLDPLIVAKVIPLEPERIVTITAHLNAEVVQVWDTACSRNRLLGMEGDEEGQRRAGRRRRDVIAVAAAEAFRDRSVLLGTYKPAVEALERTEGVDLAWFGAIRGIDRWRDRDTIVVAGREQPPPGSIETQAQAWFGDDLEPLLLTNDYVEQCRGYRMRDGSALGAIVHVHPDLRCQALLEQARERETEQMVGRLRLVHRRAPAKVILLSNLPTGLGIDRLVTTEEIVPDRLSQAIVRGGGVLPLSAGELARIYPDLWPTQRSAQHWLGRQAQEKGTQTLIRDSYWEMGTLSAATLVSYRRPGQHRGSPHQALLPGEVVDLPMAEDRLGAVLGEVENICLLEVLGRPEPQSAAGAGASQVIEDEGEPPHFHIRGLTPPSHRYIIDVLKIGEHMVLVTAPPPATMQRLQAA